MKAFFPTALDGILREWTRGGCLSVCPFTFFPLHAHQACGLGDAWPARPSPWTRSFVRLPCGKWKTEPGLLDSNTRPTGQGQVDTPEKQLGVAFKRVCHPPIPHRPRPHGETNSAGIRISNTSGRSADSPSGSTTQHAHAARLPESSRARQTERQQQHPDKPPLDSRL